jgi:hypothetical protein
MSERYCPFGRIECLQFDKLHNLCSVHNGSGDVDWEVCPWPSRQQPMDSKAETVIKADKFGKCPVGNFNCENYDLAKYTHAFNEGHAAGRADGVMECVKAVAKRADEIGGEYGDVLRDQAIAALEGVKGE